MQNNLNPLISSSEEVSPAQLAYFQWQNSLTLSPIAPPDPLLVRKVKQPWELLTCNNGGLSRSAGGVAEPLGLLPVRKLRQDKFEKENWLAIQSGSGYEYEFFKGKARLKSIVNSSPDSRNRFISENLIRPSASTGFKVTRYRSGEMTGGSYTSGLAGKIIPPPRTGKLVTTRFTTRAVVKIRRCVENSDTLLKYFHSLTFAPSLLQPWQLNPDGTVRHDFAKWKLKKYLDACSQQQRRMGKALSYCWVAELQEENTNNIHFHILMDKFFGIKWLNKIWDQANNSIDLEHMKNPIHAARYMARYMTKSEEQPIEGNRYYISQNLRDSMEGNAESFVAVRESDNYRPVSILDEIRTFIKDISQDIIDRGGRVMDHGFSIPVPRSSKKYRCRTSGEMKWSKAVDPLMAKQLYSTLREMSENKPF